MAFENNPQYSWVNEHIALYLSEPEKAHMWDSAVAGRQEGLIPTLLLTTTGRKSGKPIHLPLIYGRWGDAFVVIASKGGSPEHPAWYLNLMANPEVEVRVSADRFAATARTASEAERGPIWQMMHRVFRHFDDFQRNSPGRVFPIVLLERSAMLESASGANEELE